MGSKASGERDRNDGNEPHTCSNTETECDIIACKTFSMSVAESMQKSVSTQNLFEENMVFGQCRVRLCA